jgi:hypothetical protein
MRQLASLMILTGVYMDRFRELAKLLFGPIIDDGLKAVLPNGEFSSLLLMYWEQYVKTWVFRGCIGILTGYLLTSILSNSYFIESSKEMLAPLFWNMVVTIGLFFSLLGVLASVLTLRSASTYLFRSSYAFLKFASEVGALGFGAFIGLLCIAIYQSEMKTFIDYLYSVVGVASLAIVFVLNLIVWWVVYCLRDDVESPEYFTYIGQRKLLLVTVCLTLITVLGVVSATTRPPSGSMSEAQQSCLPE